MEKFRMEIEGLWVNIFYEYTDGDEGDSSTPPTAPRVDIKYWDWTRGKRRRRKDRSYRITSGNPGSSTSKNMCGTIPNGILLNLKKV